MSEQAGLALAGRRAVWANRSFRRFWYGESVSQIGDRVSELAIPLIAILALDASASEVGALTAAVWLPNLFSIVVGSWVEHWPSKRRLMVAADLVRAVVLLTIPVAYVAGALNLAQLFVVAIVAGAGQVVFDTAYPPFFVAMVSKRDFLDANSLLSMSRSASFIAGPALGGGLVQLLTAPVAVLVDAVSFLWSAWMIRGLRVAERPVQGPGSEPWHRRVGMGLRFVVTHPYLRAGLGCVSTVNFFTFMANALLILFASRELGLSAGVIGLAFGVGSVGGLLGAWAAPRLSVRFGVGPMIVVGSIVFPAPIALVAVAAGPAWLAAATLGAAEFISGFGVMLLDINLNAVQASVTPDAVRSRIAGAFRTINYGTRPLGALIGGLLGSYLGLRPTLLLSTLGAVLGFLWLLPSPIPRIRSLDELDDGVPGRGGQ